MILSNDHNFWMDYAIKEARLAFEEDEIPIGAIVVCGGELISKGRNQVERLNDPTAHAEMLSISSACNSLQSKFLKECSLYVTLEPCPMCAGALKWVQIGEIIISSSALKTGFTQFHPNLLHPKTKLSWGVQHLVTEELLISFFQKKRKLN